MRVKADCNEVKSKQSILVGMKFCEILPNKNYGPIHVRDRLEETD